MFEHNEDIIRLEKRAGVAEQQIICVQGLKEIPLHSREANAQRALLQTRLLYFGRDNMVND